MNETTRPLVFRCGTCGATFSTYDRLLTHLQQAYHGIQCLTCGMLLADRRVFQIHRQCRHGDHLDHLPMTRVKGA